ncbi:glycosyltransferase family 2 protein [Wenzhouxiangella sp. AB-CW3]|uniref:glycosyltransferase family 2 protein n=1 Tax=Wenzhouxiangella sp. AB-CW3 TaxID=2771012 RepID=UPI001CC2F8DD|nr:glycosyltransferase family 2 protein [Wenzhouxiangella sp. AB-CW3]
MEFNIHLNERRLGVKSSEAICEEDQPFVTVIVPAHNVVSYIGQCLESVRAQTLHDIEVIVVDDGSNDGTFDILKQFSSKDSRFRVIRNRKPSGNSGVPRNQALSLARGEYIAFLDSDDWLEKNALEELYSGAIASRADVAVATSFYRELQDGSTRVEQVEHGIYESASQPCREKLFESKYWTIAWLRIYRRSLIEKNRIRFGEFSTSSDAPFSFKALCCANRVSGVKGAFYHYRFDRPGSTVHRRRGAGSFEMLRSYKMIVEELHRSGRYDRFIPYVIRKALGDWKYNCKFLHDKHRCKFEQLMASFVGVHYESAKDSGILSKYWMDQLRHLYSLHQRKHRDLFDAYLKEHERDKPFLSIIVPAHNVEEYVQETLSSVLCQNVDNIEIIVVNDGSTDGTADVVHDFECLDGRIKIIDILEASGRPGCARNVGLAYVQGQYVGFVDADDWIASDFCEKLLNASESMTVDVVSAAGFVRMEGDKERKLRVRARDFNACFGGRENRKRLFQQRFFSNIWYRIYRTDFLRLHGIVFPRMYYSEDLCFSFVTHALADTIRVVECRPYFYRYGRPGSTTSLRQQKKALEHLEYLGVALEYITRFCRDERYIKWFFCKMMNSYLFTYQKLRELPAKVAFKQRLMDILRGYPEELVDWNFFDEEERGRLRLLFREVMG